MSSKDGRQFYIFNIFDIFNICIVLLQFDKRDVRKTLWVVMLKEFLTSSINTVNPVIFDKFQIGFIGNGKNLQIKFVTDIKLH